jgi:hypothetical protein
MVSEATGAVAAMVGVGVSFLIMVVVVVVVVTGGEFIVRWVLVVMKGQFQSCL